MPVKKNCTLYSGGPLAAATRAPKLLRSCTFRRAQLPKLLEIAFGFLRQEVARQDDANALGTFSRSGCSNVHGRPAKPDAEDAMKMCTVDESSPAGYLGHIERAAGGAR